MAALTSSLPGNPFPKQNSAAASSGGTHAAQTASRAATKAAAPAPRATLPRGGSAKSSSGGFREPTVARTAVRTASAAPYRAPSVVSLPREASTGSTKLSPNVMRWAALAEKASKATGVSKELLLADIEAESGGQPINRSSAGAEGLTQFIPSTAAEYGVKYGSGARETESQVMGQAHYLASLGVNQNPRLALEKYNGAPGSSESTSYATKVLNLAKGLGHEAPTDDLPNGSLSSSLRTLGTTGTSGTSFNKAGFEEAMHRYLIGKLLSSESGERNPLLATGLATTVAPTTGEFSTSSSTNSKSSASTTHELSGTKVAQPSSKDSHELSGIVDEANHIAEAKVPYLWGGGHAGKILPTGKVTPLDCSGAVSAALGIDPRVASEFESWGEAGKGQHVTIWAKSTHVLMEIDGKFWGTSNSNPGGGAGWIKPDVISPEYLKEFTPRHPEGL